MNIETPEVSIDLINQGFLHKLDSGMQKEAEEASTAYIRQKLYEDGILRRLFDARTVTADELDPEVDSDKPSILCEIEPDALTRLAPDLGTFDLTVDLSGMKPLSEIRTLYNVFRKWRKSPLSRNTGTRNI